MRQRHVKVSNVELMYFVSSYSALRGPEEMIQLSAKYDFFVKLF